MTKTLSLTTLILLLSSNAYAQQHVTPEPPFIFRLFSNPLFALLLGLFIVVLIISWTILPLAIFGIKKDISKIEKNTRRLEELVRLLQKQEK